MRIVTLMENTACREDLCFEHGLSLYLETENRKLLFDAGQSGAFAENAEKLKKARAATGLSQQGLADRMLIPKKTIQKWEIADRVPPPYVQRFVLNELETLRKEEKA